MSETGPFDIKLSASDLQKEIRRSPEARYSHRLHAVLLVAGGMSCRKVAELLGDAPRSVAYWVRWYEAHGSSGLGEADRPGRPRRLQQDQMGEIAAALKEPPSDYGLPGKTWNGKTLGSYIEAQFGVKLGIRQCQRLIKRLKP